MLPRLPPVVLHTRPPQHAAPGNRTNNTRILEAGAQWAADANEALSGGWRTKSNRVNQQQLQTQQPRET
ncbi:hypothetical protein M5D96_005521 [Drosophila gunungcola]|uniref:Uncharacterized protein n=1 Tax=Drosophila gunungcola TaxID=103775 RepID=A0A9P9YQW7_9MUSC|nr:hypothetical protein M5D96_005521 [Drosophila gunungcola]